MRGTLNFQKKYPHRTLGLHDFECRGSFQRTYCQPTLERPSVRPRTESDQFSFGALCYFQSGSIVLDRYRPATALQLLERILFDPEFRRSEVQDEFELHWLREDIDSLLLVLKGNLKAGAKSTNYWKIAVGKRKQASLLSPLCEGE